MYRAYNGSFQLVILRKWFLYVFAKTNNGQGAKWLMLDICDWETLLDALKLIALRRKPINHIEMEDENGKNI